LNFDMHKDRKTASRSLRVLVLGITGMLGSIVFRELSLRPDLEVMGTARSPQAGRYFQNIADTRILTGIDVLDRDTLLLAFSKTQPDVVINCIGLVKQLEVANDPLVALPINALLPHRLARLCKATGSRLIHISTDCVFSGKRGGYIEQDEADARDLYGMSKYIGELHDERHAITLRTSIIGHELNSAHGLTDWFLSRKDRIKGYRKAIFSGFPTVELVHIIADHVMPDSSLWGLYHVSSDPISKFDLLSLIKGKYQKEIEIIPDDDLVIDRSLDSSRFRDISGYAPPSWPELIQKMHSNYLRCNKDVS